MKTKYILLLTTTLTLFLLPACRENANKTAEQMNSATIISSNISPQWIFNEKEDTLGNPQTKVFVVLRDTMKIADATASFRIMEKPEYAERKFPANTLSACTGFWAGLEQQYIIVDSSDCWLVKVKFEDEDSEKPEEFQTLKVIKKL